jgi:hypothetical protein
VHREELDCVLHCGSSLRYQHPSRWLDILRRLARSRHLIEKTCRMSRRLMHAFPYMDTKIIIGGPLRGFVDCSAPTSMLSHLMRFSQRTNALTAAGLRTHFRVSIVIVVGEDPSFEIPQNHSD